MKGATYEEVEEIAKECAVQLSQGKATSDVRHLCGEMKAMLKEKVQSRTAHTEDQARNVEAEDVW